jgi:hypothetical protein
VDDTQHADQMVLRADLARTLAAIEVAEQVAADAPTDADRQRVYASRNQLTYRALGEASRLDYEVGIRLDPTEPTWPVVYIQLPTGQVSWHVPQHLYDWDGHDTAEKYRRLREYVKRELIG